MDMGALKEQIAQQVRARAGHSLIVGAAKRNGKRRISEELCEERAMSGEHVHLGLEICYNGEELCDKFVQKRVQWNGEAFVAAGGENGDK